MIGIDITNVKRFEKKDEKFVKKVLHINEIKEYNQAINKAKFLATYWAIKEALFKADNSLSNFSKIEIKKQNDKYSYNNFVISTSNEDDYIIVIVKRLNE